MIVVCPSCGHDNAQGSKFCSDCGTSLAVGETEGRKVVTILFSDLTGSTSLGERLDPESFRRVMGRFYDICRTVVSRHGGTVEKFIGDALMAVFGVPQVHEDDALRALRAALDLREELDALNDELEIAYGVRLETRTGINTGEVAVGAGEVFASGDAVNVAARLEQLAAPGEILVSESTRVLVRDAVDVEAAGPLELKGKSAPVEAWRLRGLVADVAFARRLDAPLVGRERELELVLGAYACAVAEHCCELVTVLGPAGIGKSRLVRELLSSVPDARTLTGSCLPYGEGITYWPIRSVVHAAAGLDETLGREQALERLRGLVASLPDADVIADRVAAAIGLGGGAPTEEIFWAVRKLLESLAAEQPLIVVLDDIHWAEPTLLDLIEQLATRIQGLPVLLVCMARDELLESRPAWMAGQSHAQTVRLEALGPAAVEAMLGALADDDTLDRGLRERIVATAEGNPLFVEEMVAILPEQGDGETGVPPTIQALLAARLDRLDGVERSVAGAASVVGQEFSEREVAAIDERPELAEAVSSLVRRQVFRAAELRVEPGWFRFWHLLSRDAAYAALPKTLRAELHERLGRFIEQEAGDRVGEVEELVGYHLEQAYRQRAEVGLPDARALALAVEAAGRLAACGARASARGDVHAAANLVARALALLPPDAPRRPDVQLLLGATLLEQGKLDDADRQLEEAEAGARQSGSRAVELSAQVTRTVIAVQRDPRSFDFDAAVASTEAAIAELERLDADAALAGASRVLFMIHLRRADAEKAERAAEDALERARRAGYVRGQSEAMFFLVLSRLAGPTRVDDALRSCEELLADSPGPMSSALLTTIIGSLEAELGNAEDGLLHVRQGLAELRELGFLLYAQNMELAHAQIEFHGGDLEAAERVLKTSTELLDSIGETSSSSLQHGMRALFLAQLGRFDEALEAADLGDRSFAVLGRSCAKSARALALSAAVHHEEAAAVGRQAVEIMRGTGDIHGTGIAFECLAEVLAAADEVTEARAALEESRSLYERKGCRVCATRTAARLKAPVA